MRRSFLLCASSSTMSRWNGMVPLGDQRFDPLEQLVGAHDRLRDVIVGARLFEEFLLRALHRVRRREEHRHVARGRIALQSPGDLETIHGFPVQLAVGQRDVHDHEVHRARLDFLDHPRGILGDLDRVVALPREHELEELRVHRIVFDDHDSLRHGSPAGLASALAGAPGNASVTRVPKPGPSLSIEIRPPIRWTSDFVITRPSPAPWWRRLYDPSTCENLTKSRAWSSFAIPMPVS